MSSAALSTENVSGIALWPQLRACLRFATFRASKKREMGMRFIGLVAGVTALVSISGVAAADGYRGVKDYDRPFSWTGLYVGGHAGVATGNTQGDPGLGGPLSTDYSVNGALYGGQVGFNWQTGLVVLGVE